jgi:hypothetical protein
MALAFNRDEEFYVDDVETVNLRLAGVATAIAGISPVHLH